MSEKCAESAIDHFDFIFHSRGEHYVFHTNQFLLSLRFVKTFWQREPRCFVPILLVGSAG